MKSNQSNAFCTRNTLFRFFLSLDYGEITIRLIKFGKWRSCYGAKRLVLDGWTIARIAISRLNILNRNKITIKWLCGNYITFLFNLSSASKGKDEANCTYLAKGLERCATTEERWRDGSWANISLYLRTSHVVALEKENVFMQSWIYDHSCSHNPPPPSPPSLSLTLSFNLIACVSVWESKSRQSTTF